MKKTSLRCAFSRIGSLVVWAWLLLAFVTKPTCSSAQTFAHPSIPFTNADLAQLKANITTQPWLNGYNALRNDSHSQLSYAMKGPFATVSRVPNLNNEQWKSDMIAIHNLAFMWVFTGDSAYARKATNMLDAWAVINTTWGGGENMLDLGDYAPYYVTGADILRGTFPGWKAANTAHVKSYFNNVIWPTCYVPYPLRDHNKGAIQLEIAMGVAAFLDDPVKWQQALEVYRIDAGGGMRNSLPNGEVGDTGRDDHWFVQVQALCWSAEVAWKQGVDVFAELNNRLLAVNELYNQYSIAPSTTTFIPFGGYSQYYTNWGIRPGVRHQSPCNNIIQGAYALRKGIPTPYTSQMRNLVGEGSWSFLYLKSADASTATPLTPIPYSTTTDPAGQLTNLDIGNTGISGSASYANGIWTVQGAGTSLPNAVNFTSKPITGNAAMIVKVDANTNSGATIGLMLRASLAAGSDYVAVRLGGSRGMSSVAQGDYGRNSGSHYQPAVPWWLKLERVGNRVFTYHSQDGINWTNNALYLINLPANAYLGFYTLSGNNSQLTTTTFRNVSITDTNPFGVPAISSALLAADTIGTAFSYATAASNSPSSFSATGLPTGLSLNASTGVISGTPTAVGQSLVTLTASNSQGTGSAVLVLNVTNSVAPAAPRATASISNSTRIALSWAAIPNALIYTVKRSLSASGPFTVLQAGLTVTSFIDYNPTPEVPNYYVVTASSGPQESGNSNIVSASVPPAVPSTPIITNQVAQLNLTWSTVTGARNYRVKRSTTKGGAYTTVASPTTNSYSDLSVVSGTGYYYVVSAVGNTLESANSPEAFGMPGATALNWSPTSPTDSLALAGNWVENATPISPAILTFAATADSSTVLTNDVTGLQVARLAFASDADGYTIGGNPLTLTQDVISDSPFRQTLTMPLMLSNQVTVADDYNLSFTGNLSGTGSLRKTGNGLLYINGNNTYSGTTLINGTGGGWPPKGGIEISGIGTGTASAPTSGPLGTGRIILSGGSLSTPQAATLYNDIEVPAGVTGYTYQSSGAMNLYGRLLGGGTLEQDGNVYDGLHLFGDNSGFTGTFKSKLRSGNQRVRFEVPQSGSASAYWLLDANGVDCHSVTFGTGTLNFGALAGRGYIRNDGGGTPTISIGALNLTTTYDGTMDKSINVDKVGTGTLIFRGYHNYWGTTTIKNGRFLLNNDPATATFVSPIVAQAGYFGGTGISSAPVTIGTGSGAGATLEPGSQAIGTFTTTGLLSLLTDATYALELNLGAGTGDQMRAGSVTLQNPTLAVSVPTAGTLAQGTTFTIINNTGATAVTGTFNNLPELALLTIGGYDFRITYKGGTGNDVVVLDNRTLPALITSSATANGIVNKPFSYTITAINSPTSYAASGLPAGLSVNTSTGVIAGTPTTVGTYSVTLSTTHPNGTATQSLTLTIEDRTVTGLLVASGDAKAVLDWDAISNVNGYNVKRATTAGGPYTTLTSATTATRYVDATVSNGTSYYYVVSSVDANGENPKSSEAAALPTLGQVAYYKFNEASGTRGIDAWGGNHAILQATAIRAVGYGGQALQLTGAATSYATLPTGVVNGLTNYTVSSWVKMASISTWMRVFDFGNSGTQYMFLTVQAGVTSGKSIVRFGTKNGSAAEQNISYNYTFPLNTWVHLAVTRAANTVTLYLNGTAVATGTITTAVLGSTTLNYLGKSQFNDPLFNGSIDDFQLYNRALNSEEMSRLYSTPAPLPVTMTSFTVSPSGNHTANLKWTTASELHNAYFLVERSSDGQQFTAASGQLAPAGPSGGAYRYADTTPLPATSYYRLRQVDLDGTSTYSPVRAVTLGAATADWTAYPNPATNGRLYVQLGTQAPATVTVSLYNALGARVLTKTFEGVAPESVLPIELGDNLATGTYFLRLNNEVAIPIAVTR